MAELSITVCFSPAPRQVCELALHVPVGSSLQQAVALAAGLPEWPEGWDMDRCASLTHSLWGRKVAWDATLRVGDRVELCRALRVDPKVARRQRFKQQGARRTGLFAKKRPGAAAGY